MSVMIGGGNNGESSDLRSLLESEIPDGRLNLENSYTNLEKVAAYCEANYLQQVGDKKRDAFEETKRYTVQSLASVAYQINTLASALLTALDLQAKKIDTMVSDVNKIEQIVDIHKEKVARREIGVITANKSAPRQHKIITPLQQERPERYQRKPIDYTLFDNLGHGVKLQPTTNSNLQQQRQFITRTASTVSGGSSSSGGQQQHHANFPNYEQLLPKAIQSHASTLSRASTTTTTSREQPQYRTPIVSNQSSLMGDRYSNANYSTQGSYSSVSVGRGMSTVEMPLPPPQLASVAQYRLSSSSADGLPPPPPLPSDIMMIDGNERSSPPLPPPPAVDGFFADMPQYGSYLARRHELPDWVPHDYIEKAVALYDYEAQKPDELTFHENAIIYVLRKNDDGWYEGVVDGVTGLFPGNYVQSI